ncbi:metallophosphoesterase [Flexivirga endophytica]|uniref:Metallophosphoesterase n=1 Tax=Flexivirga endophytica TaxID=1849103 RepID=A0A916T1U2_9MICO|nr:metallophosphoesterase [Flexivirga endophytica]GGB26366.1 metallophosphoesterase [Flexivirga endophytica]GHB54879.1 metallophosphoesterase [Flexivirga endophytica]
MHALTKTSTAIAGTGLGTLAWASLVERHLYILRRFTVPVLAPGARPLRVLQVSDLHLVPRQERRIDWVRGLAALEPDFVVNTGDNCSDLHAVPSVLHAMEPLMDFPGAFVLGSNDYYAPMPKNPLKYVGLGQPHPKGPEMRTPNLPVQDLVDGFIGGGWTDLDNVRTTLEIAHQPVEFVGVNDPHIELDDYASVAGPAASDVAATVGVVHAPYVRVLDPMTADGAGLVLAGHTHGGQVCVPFYGALTTNCDLDNARAKGVSRWWPGASGHRDADGPDDAAWLHVSAGLGHNKYNPVRLACRPEATLLTLVAR